MSRLQVHGFAEDAAAVERLAGRLAVPPGLIDLHRFPDGEVLPTVPLTGAATVILYRSLHDANQRLVSLLLAADACRRSGVTRLVLVAPYLCYLRQDAVFQPGQPLSRDLVGRWLGAAFDRVVTVQAHLHRTTDLSDVFGVPAESLSISADLAALAAEDDRPLVVGPDIESRPLVEQAARRLGTDWITFDKTRLGDRQVRLMLPSPDRVAGRAVLILDDVCSSGGTLERAIALLRQAGARSIDIAVAHALFEADVEARLRAAGARRILSSESVPHPTNAMELAEVLAAALRAETTA
ncbi:MAG: ribose-phosphate diphosphokinase [Caulobacterales bacterium]|nr:ribose-phosphate diphosphokinase [Caulobacterales bacterium]